MIDNFSQNPKFTLLDIMKLFVLLLIAPLSILAKQPNVLFILVDDLGAMDLTNEGSTFYETPNIDRIANEGMIHQGTPPVGYAALPCQYFDGKYPTNHKSLNTLVALREWVNNKGRHDSHLPPEYERNLRASKLP